MGTLSKNILYIALGLCFSQSAIADATQANVSYRQLEAFKVGKNIVHGQARSTSVAHGAAIEVTGPDNVCKNVMNATGNTLFIPANTLGEWQAFVNATIPGVTKGSCAGHLPDPPAPSCGGILVGGFCWYQGAPGQSCTAACASHGGYNAATNAYAGQGASAGCTAVASQFYGPPIVGNGGYRWIRGGLQVITPRGTYLDSLGCHSQGQRQSQSNCEVVDETDDGTQTLSCSMYPLIALTSGMPATADATPPPGMQRFCACNN